MITKCSELPVLMQLTAPYGVSKRNRECKLAFMVLGQNSPQKYSYPLYAYIYLNYLEQSLNLK